MTVYKLHFHNLKSWFIGGSFWPKLQLATLAFFGSNSAKAFGLNQKLSNISGASPSIILNLISNGIWYKSFSNVQLNYRGSPRGYRTNEVIIG